jgi:short-subunit dehydrogenase
MNKNVLITGASKGLGLALSYIFARENYNLALCARSETDLYNLKKEINDKHPSLLVFAKSVDVTIKKDLILFGNEAKSFIGHIDVLINNVGIFIPGKITEEEDGVFEKMIQTNLAPAYFLSRLFAPDMIKKKKGHIVNICSTASFVAYVNGGSYCISKYGELGLTRVLREELKPHGVKVTAVLLGATNTNSWVGSGIEESRIMDPVDVATTIWNAVNLPSNAVIEELTFRPQLGDID